MRSASPKPQQDAPPSPAGARPPGVSRRTAALAVAAVLVAFFAPALLGGGDFVYRDTGRLHAPMKRWIGEELASGRFPQWNPYAGIGAPVVANAIDAPQHPFGALLVALSPAAAVRAWILLSFALAAAGAFAWARSAGRSEAGAAVAALAFALSGPLVSSSDNVTYLTTYAALPWVLAAAHAHVARGGPLTLLGVAAAAALCAAGGDPQAWAFAVGALPIYALAAAPAGGRGLALRRGLAAAGVAALASAPFVLPILAWVPHSERAAVLPAAQRIGWNLHPRRLAELVVPDLLRDDVQNPVSLVFKPFAGNEVTSIPWFMSVYVGAAVLVLAVAGAVESRLARVHVAAAAVVAWAALGHYAGFGWIAGHLPVLRSFRYWEKLAVWVPLLLAPAAAVGAEALARGVRARGVALGAAAGASVLLVLAGVAALAPGLVVAWAGGPPGAALRLAENLASGAGRAGLVLALLAGVALLVGRGRFGGAAPLAVGAIVALDLFGGNAGAYVLGPPERLGRPPLAASLPAGARVFSPFSLREDRFPRLGRLGSTWEWQRRTLAASWNVPLRIGSEQDYVGLRDARWLAITEAMKTGGNVARLGLFGFSHVVTPGAPELAARTGVPAPFQVAASDPELPAFLVEVPHRPRAYVAGAPFQAGEAEALAFAMGGGGDGRTAVEGPVPEGRLASSGEARIVSDLPGDTRVAVRAGDPALLVLNDLHAPGWTATIDGRPAPIVRANAVARGVWVDAGAHEVRFRYRTPGLAAGWALLGGVALALGAWAVAARRRRAGSQAA